MTRLLKFVAGFALMISVVGCCYRPGYYDPVTGMAYGGYWEPCCGGPFDPFCMWSCGNWRGCHGYGSGCYGYGSVGGASCGCGLCDASLVSPTYGDSGYMVEPYSAATVYDNACHCHPHVLPGPAGPVIPSESAEPTPSPQPAPPAEETTYYQTWPSNGYDSSSITAPQSGGEVIQEGAPPHGWSHRKWLPARF